MIRDWGKEIQKQNFKNENKDKKEWGQEGETEIRN